MVAVPTIYHEEVGLALAEAGVHAIIEKPLAQDTPSADQGRRGVRGQGPRRRGRPHRALQPGPPAGPRRASRPASSATSTRCRPAGRARSRRASPTSASSRTSAPTTSTSPPGSPSRRSPSVAARTAYKSGRELEDLVAVVGQLSNGTVTNHLVNWLSPLKERVTIITGEQGRVRRRHPHRRPHLLRQRRGRRRPGTTSRKFRGVSEGDVVRYAIAKPEPLRVEHEQFRDAVLGKDADIVTMEQGLQTVRVAEACIESATTGQTDHALTADANARLLEAGVRASGHGAASVGQAAADPLARAARTVASAAWPSP